MAPGSSQGDRADIRGGACPQSSIEWIFIGKNWHCSLYQNSEVLCSVGLKYLIYHNMDTAAGSAFKGDKKKRSPTFLRKKCTLADSVAPNVKSWLRACDMAQ